MAFRSAFSSAFSPAFRSTFNTDSPEDLGVSGLFGLPMYLHDGDIYLRPDGRSFYNRPTTWILESGTWDDAGVWNDAEAWID